VADELIVSVETVSSSALKAQRSDFQRGRLARLDSSPTDERLTTQSPGESQSQRMGRLESDLSAEIVSQFSHMDLVEANEISERSISNTGSILTAFSMLKETTQGIQLLIGRSISLAGSMRAQRSDRAN